MNLLQVCFLGLISPEVILLDSLDEIAASSAEKHFFVWGCLK
jgi:hypothetical protein